MSTMNLQHRLQNRLSHVRQGKIVHERFYYDTGNKALNRRILTRGGGAETMGVDGKDDLSRALLRLHKALLDDERVSYERVHGRIPSNGAFLQLVLGDAWFAWLRPLSQLMAKLDELGEEEEASARTEITALLVSAQTILTPTEEGEGFGRHYHDALQRGPDVVLAHAAVRALLRQPSFNKE